MSKHEAPHYSFVVGGTADGKFLILTVHSKGMNFDKKLEEWYLKVNVVNNPYAPKKEISLGPLWEIEKKFTEKECVFDSFDEAYDKLLEIGEKYQLEKVL